MIPLWTALACGSPPEATEPPPEEAPVSDAAAFAELRTFVLREAPAWSGRADYNPDDPALVDPVLRKVVDQRNFGRVPPTTAERQRLATAIANSVWAGQLSRPEWRAAVEEKVRAYWAAPRVTTTSDGGLVMDLGICPGPITQWSSGRYGITTSEYADRGQLRRDVVADRLLALVERQRGAAWFEVQVQVPAGHRSPERYRYRYDPGKDVLYVLLASQEGTVWVSPAPLGGDLGSLKTTSPTRTEELRGLRRGRDVPAF
jgi:hypothetical protein